MSWKWEGERENNGERKDQSLNLNLNELSQSFINCDSSIWPTVQPCSQMLCNRVVSLYNTATTTHVQHHPLVDSYQVHLLYLSTFSKYPSLPTRFVAHRRKKQSQHTLSNGFDIKASKCLSARSWALYVLLCHSLWALTKVKCKHTGKSKSKAHESNMQTWEPADSSQEVAEVCLIWR